MAAAVGVLIPRDIAAGRFVEYVQRAEERGFQELWVVEDCCYRGGIAQAAVALSFTRRVHVGIGILPAGVRNAVYAASEIATLATLYPGRLSVGVGHGMPKWMRKVGETRQSPMALLEETLQCIRDLLWGRRLSMQGRYVRLDDVGLQIVPELPPPVLAGVRSPKSLRLSGRIADGTILAEPVTTRYVLSARDAINSPSHTIVAYNLAAVHSDADVAYEQVRREVAQFGDRDWAPHLQPLDIGTRFLELRARCRSQEEFAGRLPRDWLNALGIVGTPEEGRTRLKELAAVGVNTSVLIPTGSDPLNDLAELSVLL